MSAATAAKPSTAEELAEGLRDAGLADRPMQVGGAFTKDRWGGPLPQSPAVLSTQSMNRVLQYEPKDLTISVEAGMPWADLESLLDENGQMIPLDPAVERGTVGGVVASNQSGPRRRQYGTARDLVIGMTFATLEGKLVKVGGMVVKNVAGLDMGKLMIGSYGTLAAIASVNFKLIPKPEQTCTFASPYSSLAEAVQLRDELLKSQLQPMAIDLWKAEQSRLLVQVGGSARVVDRYRREFESGEALTGEAERAAWQEGRRFLVSQPCLARISCPLDQMRQALERLPGRALCRAGNGVIYAAFAGWRDASAWLSERPWPGVIERVDENCPHGGCPAESWWPKPGGDFATMEKVKDMFDPRRLLNPGRLHGRL